MKGYKLAIGLAIGAALLLPSAAGAAAAKPSYELEWEGGGQSSGTVIARGGVSYIAAKAIASEAGLAISWDVSKQRAQFDGWNKSFAVRVNSDRGVLDGKNTEIGGKPFVLNGELYLPIRFIVKALDGDNVKWNARTQTVTASGLGSYHARSETHNGLTFTVVTATGELYVTGESGESRKLADLGDTIYGAVKFAFYDSPGGLLHLTVTRNYGEPMIQYRVYTAVLKDGELIREAEVSYFRRFVDNATNGGGQLIVTDGRTLELVDDVTGRVAESYDLVKLGGEEDDYFVEGVGPEYLLIRPNDRGLLMLIDRKTGGKTLLYKELLDKLNQEYAETNDVPYFGDWLRFVRRDGDTLYFRNDAPIQQDNKLYAYKLPE
ncbi:copper amine oxidase [Paenibacillus sp. 32O-W]|uniref:copper amine oxidase N-terminal domain-containing protein n=1 Tax=Paenibacillus sp. 32O-W TaxID=1695218 RepID=UPI0007215F9E|nr:copper amine oxidase N-terminal domain-containing protein [Paenibacillus sp. 32O-W]ALS28325.1 copper amine oxidase [Paenibacillus sp. 32O-W]